VLAIPEHNSDQIGKDGDEPRFRKTVIMSDVKPLPVAWNTDPDMMPGGTNG
jgi:hypothetical protein